MANKNHFNLTLDTTKPTGGIECSVRATNKVEELKISYNSDAAYMKVWFDEYDNSASNPTTPQGEWMELATTKQTAFATEGTYYYHVQFVDSIGNESEIYTTEYVIYDITPATIDSFEVSDKDSGSKTLSNAKEVKYAFKIADDSVSGIKSAVISGDCVEVAINNPATGEVVEGELELTGEDGSKSLVLTVTDNAGNIKTANVAITLDMTLDAAIIEAYRTEEDSANLIANYSNVSNVYVKLNSVDSGVAGYKIWHTGESEPVEFTADKAYAKSFSLADGSYTINAKVIDEAGNITESTAKSFVVDTKQPTGTVAVDKSQLSDVDGFNKVVITATAADQGVGLADQYVVVNGAKQEATWSEGATTIEITSSQANIEGANIIEVYAQDKAMEEANVAAVKIAEVSVQYDKTAPTAEFGTPNAWYTKAEDVELAITHADGTGVGVEKLYVWVDKNATAATVPAEVSATAALNSGSVYVPNRSAMIEGKNYFHALVVDKVGNSVMINSEEFGFDSVVPGQPSISFDASIYPSATATVTITASDATSGLNLMWVEGDITNPTPAEGENFATTRSVTLKDGDGEKTIKVKVSDKAGNISEYSVVAKTVLDTTAPAATIVLVKRGSTEALGNFSAVAEFDAQIAGVDDAGQEGKAQYYQVYGPGIGVEYKEDAFVELVYDEGKTYKTVQLVATENAADATSGEVKEVYVIVKDDAGHKSDAVKAQFTYDPSAAEIEVKDVSDNIISCVHAFRRTSVSTVNEKYCDEVSFKFIPDSNIVAYKVCAFASQEAAVNAGDPALLNAIGMNKGSLNMSATNIVSKQEVSCLIKGEDLQAYVGNDGAYIIVVYAQNEAGVWSEAAKF